MRRVLLEDGVCWPRSLSRDLIDEDLVNWFGWSSWDDAGFRGEASDSCDRDGRIGDGRLLLLNTVSC